MTTRLVTITLPTFRSLANGDQTAIHRDIGLPVPADFVESADASGIWNFMIGLLEGHPENDAWVMRLVVHDDVVVGNAGFKGAPQDGEVELGYRIAPAHRRRGFASAAVAHLLEHARVSPDVDRVIARIDPDNDASVAVATKAGFVPDGEFMNARWGRQLQFAHSLGAPGQ